jgi:hypothetical protein
MREAGREKEKQLVVQVEHTACFLTTVEQSVEAADKVSENAARNYDDDNGNARCVTERSRRLPTTGDKDDDGNDNDSEVSGSAPVESGRDETTRTRTRARRVESGKVGRRVERKDEDNDDSNNDDEVVVYKSGNGTPLLRGRRSAENLCNLKCPTQLTRRRRPRRTTTATTRKEKDEGNDEDGANDNRRATTTTTTIRILSKNRRSRRYTTTSTMTTTRCETPPCSLAVGVVKG